MRKRIGEFMIEKGLLNNAQLGDVLRHSKDTGLRFGEAAMDMGLLQREQLLEAFGPNWTVDFFYLDPEFFPESTKDLLPVDLMARLGVLPLGYKLEPGLFKRKKVLNIGVVNPSRSDGLDELKAFLAQKSGQDAAPNIKLYLILGDQFLRVLEQVYGARESEIRQLDETAALFSEN